MDDEEMKHIDKRLEELRHQEGMVDQPDKVLYFGYLSRGKPLQFFDGLFKEMGNFREEKRRRMEEGRSSVNGFVGDFHGQRALDYGD